MTTKLHNMTLHIALADSGDAIIWGLEDGRELTAAFLRKLLFAWHEPSLYGTRLEVKDTREVSVIILPAEMVLSFLADPYYMDILRWDGGDSSTKALLQTAPALYRAVQASQYVPSFTAFRGGKLEWLWDSEAEEVKQLDLWMIDNLTGLQAAFSEAVKAEHYADGTALAELRREYPALFRGLEAASSASAADAADGADRQQEWLIALGWKPDTAPFRPALQLLEPDDEDAEWRLRLVLQAKADNTALVPMRLYTDGHAAGTWASDWSPHIRERAPGWAARLAEALPEQRSGGELFAEPLSDAAAWRFLTADSRRLLEDGWHVMLPAWWEAASKRKPRLRAQVASEAGGRGQSLFGLNALVDFDWRIAIGDTDLSEAEFKALLSRGERLVRFRGEWVYLDPALLDQIRKLMDSVNPEEGLSLQDVLQLHLLKAAEAEQPQSRQSNQDKEQEEEERIQLEVELNHHLMELLRQLNQPSDLELLPVPTGLQAELRSYQREGFTWLSFLRQFGLGACLADDMGLGKTIQFITYLLQHKPVSTSPALLVCPTSVLGNWQKELARFAPELRVRLHYGKHRLTEETIADALADSDVIITSYTTALMDQELLQNIVWSSLCLDEAQNIKNAQNKQSAAIRSLQAQHRIALTGTPIENRLSELWSIYDFLNPGYLGSQRGFQQRFANPIEKYGDEERTTQLQRLVKPFMLRRKKKDPAIQLDLPDKLEMKVYIHLTPEQGALYEQTVKALMERMQQLEGIERKGAILAALTRLKQLCDHPELLTKSEEIPQSEAGREAFIMRSAKLERLVAMVGELREEGDSCLIFTQYVGMGQMLTEILSTQLGEPVQYLNGSTSKDERDRMIEQFQSTNEDTPHIFVLSLKAGGVGLNLTAANHVFHFDRWWNPAVENQATDRAYRMGQKRDVQVHKFISLGTLEERIDEMLESKMSLSENVITSSEGWITELSNDELRDLFTLRQEWN